MTPTDDLEAQVVALLANERGIAPARLQRSDRLLHDLGIDGDDAVDFFIDKVSLVQSSLWASPPRLIRYIRPHRGRWKVWSA